MATSARPSSRRGRSGSSCAVTTPRPPRPPRPPRAEGTAELRRPRPPPPPTSTGGESSSWPPSKLCLFAADPFPCLKFRDAVGTLEGGGTTSFVKSLFLSSADRFSDPACMEGFVLLPGMRREGEEDDDDGDSDQDGETRCWAFW